MSDLVKRYCEIFRLRNVAGDASVDRLIESFWETDSNLLRHETCYVLGQIRNPKAITFLQERLRDHAENGMVRHEAAEALGAIGDSNSIDILNEFAKDPVPEVAQTCELAVSRIMWTIKDQGREGELESRSPYLSVDPAPPPPSTASVQEMRENLLNADLSMFDRYRAMFGLRNIGGVEAVKALCDCMLIDKSSPLLRHELAYVLGQMQDITSAPALSKVLEDAVEHEMVRHEAAEALGCIAPEEQLALLGRFEHDQNRVVADSCEVAIAMYRDDFVYI
jgi:deoxyhypusine monooxygenase